MEVAPRGQKFPEREISLNNLLNVPQRTKQKIKRLSQDIQNIFLCSEDSSPDRRIEVLKSFFGITESNYNTLPRVLQDIITCMVQSEKSTDWYNKKDFQTKLPLALRFEKNQLEWVTKHRKFYVVDLKNTSSVRAKKSGASLDSKEVMYAWFKRNTIDGAHFSKDNRYCIMVKKNRAFALDQRTNKVIIEPKEFEDLKKKVSKVIIEPKECEDLKKKCDWSFPPIKNVHYIRNQNDGSVGEKLIFTINGYQLLVCDVSHFATFTSLLLPYVTCLDNNAPINAMCYGHSKEQLFIVTDDNIVMLRQDYYDKIPKTHYLYTKKSYFSGACCLAYCKQLHQLAIAYNLSDGKAMIKIYQLGAELSQVGRTIFFGQVMIKNMCFNKKGNVLAVGSEHRNKKSVISLLQRHVFTYDQLLLRSAIYGWLQVKKQHTICREILKSLQNSLKKNPEAWKDCSTAKEHKKNIIVSHIFRNIEQLFFLEEKKLNEIWQALLLDVQDAIMARIVRVINACHSPWDECENNVEDITNSLVTP
jgi:hypothetical protein